MTKRAGSRPPRVSLASPVTQPPSVRHSARISGPPARWMAPSTPPPPSSVVLAAFTIASVACVVMSPRTSPTAAPAQSRRRTLARYHRRPREAILELRPRPPRATSASSHGGDGMERAVEAEPRAVVFVCDRQGAALGRRERCLRLAGIPFEIEAERRPSGTYYKLGVRERDAVAAHLALQMGGCGRSSRLRQSQSGVAASPREMAHTPGDEALPPPERPVDLGWTAPPRPLTGPPRAPRRAPRAAPPL